MKLCKNIKSSIYNPSYYSEILNKPFSYSLKYFLSLACLVALIATIAFSFSTLPKINKFINETGSKALSYYPDDLEVTVKSGKVSTNVSEPYFIKIPDELKNSDRGTVTNPAAGEIENLLVIDTKNPATIDLFSGYKTSTLLSYDSFAYYDNGAVKIQPLRQEFNGVVTKPKVSAALNKIMPYVRILPFALIPIIFIGLLIGSIFKYLIYLIFAAVIIWIMFKAMKKNLGYGKSYQIGLHAMTLGVILEVTVFRFYPNLEFPFLFTFLMLVVFWANFNFSSCAGSFSSTRKIN